VTPEAEGDEGDGRHGPGTVDLGRLADRAREILDAAWRAEDGPGRGFCVPHPATYPWQWLWDSCFHAVVWAHLGDERAAAELDSALVAIDEDGFVPHMRYAGTPSPHEGFWGRPGTSSITQPPMYGHAAAELARLGLDPAPATLERAGAGLRFLLARRRRSRGGLIELCHPWESGCDDSPRWDGVLGVWNRRRWYDAKGALLDTIERSPGGAPLANPAFAVASAGFNALVAFNARELAGLTGDDLLEREARALAEALDDRWDPELRTWVDDGPTAGTSGRIRTLDALLPALVTARRVPEVLAPLVDPGAHGAPYGPTGVHRAEPTFAPSTYWRGSAWPQLSYLCWVATRSAVAGSGATAGSSTGSSAASLEASLRRSMADGAMASGFAEHWDPDTAAGLGAVPQSWSTLALVAATSR
jgi:glucosylglycerate hydrolase